MEIIDKSGPEYSAYHLNELTDKVTANLDRYGFTSYYPSELINATWRGYPLCSSTIYHPTQGQVSAYVNARIERAISSLFLDGHISLQAMKSLGIHRDHPRSNFGTLDSDIVHKYAIKIKQELQDRNILSYTPFDFYNPKKHLK